RRPRGRAGRRVPRRRRHRARGRGGEARARRGDRAVSINFSAWAIGRPLPALMLFFALCVAGLWGFHQLPVARFPDIAFPMTTITITQPGASPSQLEAEVTRRVED